MEHRLGDHLLRSVASHPLDQNKHVLARNRASPFWYHFSPVVLFRGDFPVLTRLQDIKCDQMIRYYYQHTEGGVNSMGLGIITNIRPRR